MAELKTIKPEEIAKLPRWARIALREDLLALQRAARATAAGIEEHLGICPQCGLGGGTHKLDCSHTT